MVERRGGFGFADEAFVGLRIGAKVGSQKFEGDRPVEAGVVGFVDDAHAAAAELFDDAILRNGASDHSKKSRR